MPMIKPLRESLYMHHAAMIPDFSYEFDFVNISKYDAILSDKNSTKVIQVLVATTTVDHTPVAYSLAKIDSGNNAELDSLFVKKEYRGKGLAVELSQKAIDWMALHHPIHISVRILPNNDVAKALYEKLGFKPRSLIMRIKDDNKAMHTDGSSAVLHSRR